MFILQSPTSGLLLSAAETGFKTSNRADDATMWRAIQGGFGSAVLEFMVDQGYSSRVKRLGVPDRFIEHGTQRELYDECGYGRRGIADAVRDMVTVKVTS